MQGHSELHVVTGSFGYSGRYITERLVQAGTRVRRELALRQHQFRIRHRRRDPRARTG